MTPSKRSVDTRGTHPTIEGRRARILAATARLFRTQGFERTTVRRIADAVGLQSGSLFHHFKSKEGILFAVMEDGVRQALAAAYDQKTTFPTALVEEGRRLGLVNLRVPEPYGGGGLGVLEVVLVAEAPWGLSK